MDFDTMKKIVENGNKAGAIMEKYGMAWEDRVELTKLLSGAQYAGD